MPRRPAVPSDDAAVANIWDRIEGHYPSLRPSEQRVAALLRQDPEAAMYYSIDELAERAGTSKTTIVRFARSLGYKGFSDFRVDLARSKPGVKNLFQRLGDVASVGELGERLLQASLRTLELTLSLVVSTELEAVVQAIRQAERVHLYGVGSSGLVALDAQHKLQRVMIPAWGYIDPHQQLAGAAQLAAGDVAICISYSGQTKEIIDAARVVSERGATVVAITGDKSAPLAKLAAHVLLVGRVETPGLSGAVVSRIGELFLIDLLSLAIARSDPGRVKEYLERMNTLTAARRRGR